MLRRVGLPPRRTRPKMGIPHAPRRIFQTHRAYVRRHACSVPGCRGEPIEFAHVRSARNAGTGQKPSDIFGVSLCVVHHREQHSRGAETFQAKYGIDLWAIAATFARTTTDKAMRAQMAEMTPREIAE